MSFPTSLGASVCVRRQQRLIKRHDCFTSNVSTSTPQDAHRARSFSLSLAAVLCATNGTVTATTASMVAGRPAGRLGVTFAQVHLQVSERVRWQDDAEY